MDMQYYIRDGWGMVLIIWKWDVIGDWESYYEWLQTNTFKKAQRVSISYLSIIMAPVIGSCIIVFSLMNLGFEQTLQKFKIYKIKK